MDELKKISDEYDSVVSKLIETVGNPEHKDWIKKERELNIIDVNLRKKLGIYVSDPCYLTRGRICESCTGKIEFYSVLKKNKKGELKEVSRCRMVTDGGEKCILRTI